MSTRLTIAARDRAIRGMQGTELDVLVVGGGVVGAGAALDAASRGLTTAIVDARDWASGTSSRSSKLIHGGLRYLEMLDFGLVREALRERALLIGHLAPHLVRPVPFLYPLAHRGWERPYVGAGVLLYDTMGSLTGPSRGLPMHRHLSKRAALLEAPCLRPDALTGAIRYWDAQVDDARHTLTVVRTAVAYGALAANRTRVTRYVRDGDRVVGADLVDMETGDAFTVRARQVVNATGVWTDEVQRLAATRTDLRVRASKGVHLVVPRERLDLLSGLILRTESSVLFIIPWGRFWIIGTTDTDWHLDLAHPAASAHDIDYLLTQVNSVVRTPLSRDDVVGVYAGLRPLLSGTAESTAKLSREHVVGRPAPGLVVIAGGKYTTYRLMAKDAVDQAVLGLGRDVPPSCTEDVPLLGAHGWAAVQNRRDQYAHQYGLNVNQIDRLLHRYGNLIEEVLAPLAGDPGLAAALPGTPDYLRAEALYAATSEGALHLEDVLTRRTRVSIETWDRGAAAAPVVAELVGPILGWDRQRQEAEVEKYQARVAAERGSQCQPDDDSANAVRIGNAELTG
jgi:glycerol-3-phosphate dehydrogenase